MGKLVDAEAVLVHLVRKQRTSELLKLGASQRLGEDISNVIIGADPLDLNDAGVDNCANKVMTQCNMLGLGTVLRILGQLDCTSIVSV